MGYGNVHKKKNVELLTNLVFDYIDYSLIQFVVESISILDKSTNILDKTVQLISTLVDLNTNCSKLQINDQIIQ